MNDKSARKLEPTMPAALAEIGPGSPTSAVVVEPPPATQTVTPVAPLAATTLPSERNSLDQLARIEDKAARIEEKYARSEALLMRVESAVEKATLRLDEAATHMDLGGLKETVARIERRQRRRPGYIGLVLLIVLTAAASALGTAYLVRNPSVLSSVIGPR